MASVSELLDKPTHWLKGRAWDGERRYCLYGAIGQVYVGTPQCSYQIDDIKLKIPVRRAEAVIERLYPKRSHFGITGFNDHPNTTFEEVRAVIREADL